MAGYILRWFHRPQTVTHPSTIWALHRATTLIKTKTLPLSQDDKWERVRLLAAPRAGHLMLYVAAVYTITLSLSMQQGTVTIGDVDYFISRVNVG